MKRCGVTRRETTERMEYRDKVGHRHRRKAAKTKALWTTATPEEALHDQPLMVHFLHTKKPKKQCLVSCQALLSVSFSTRKTRERLLKIKHSQCIFAKLSA